MTSKIRERLLMTSSRVYAGSVANKKPRVDHQFYDKLVRESYVSDDLLPALENDLSTMPGRIIRLSELCKRDDPSGAARTIAECIGYIKYGHGLTEDIRFALSEAPYHNAIAIGRTNTLVVSMTMLRNIQALIAQLSLSAQFDTIWSFSASAFPPRVGTKQRHAAIADLIRQGQGMSITARLGEIMPVVIRFIAFHELGHIVNGHAKSGISKRFNISEDQDLSRNDDLLTRRTLEYDADSFAAHHLLQMNLFRSNPRETAHGEHFEIVRSLILSAVGPYSVMCSLDTSLPKLQQAHPPAPARMTYLRKMLKNYLPFMREIGISVPLRGLEIVEHSILATENAIAEIGDSASFDAEALAYWRLVATQQEVLMAQRWAKIRPTLMKARLGTHELAPAVLPPA